MSDAIMVQRLSLVGNPNEANFVPFKRSILAEILGEHAIVQNGEISGANFGGRDWGVIYGAEEEDITTVAFVGGGEKFMQMIWEVADRTLSFIFWIGEPPNLAVTSEAALAETPQRVVDDIGPAHIVRNGRELNQCIFGEVKSG